jgi:hypothetical protein
MKSHTVTFSYNPKGFIPHSDRKTLLAHQLLGQLAQHTDVSPESQIKWQETSSELVEILRSWKQLYKVLEHKKKQLKRQVMGEKKSSSEDSESSKDNSSKERSEESNYTDESDHRPLKRRRG